VQAAINAANVPAARPAPTRLSTVKSIRRRADPHPRADFRQLASFKVKTWLTPLWRRKFPTHRRGHGFDQRRAEAGGTNPGQSNGTGFLRTQPEDLRTVLGQANVDQAKGILENQRQASPSRRMTSCFRANDYKDVDHCLPQWRSGAPARRGHHHRRRRERQAGCMDEPFARGRRQHTAPAGATSSAWWTRHPKKFCRNSGGAASSVKVAIFTDRTETIRHR